MVLGLYTLVNPQEAIGKMQVVQLSLVSQVPVLMEHGRPSSQ